MFIINRTRGDLEITVFGTFSRKTFEANGGMRINHNNTQEVAYYKCFNGSGLMLVPDETYERMTGTVVTKAPEVKPVIVEVEEVKEVKKEYVKPAIVAEVVEEVKSLPVAEEAKPKITKK